MKEQHIHSNSVKETEEIGATLARTMQNTDSLPPYIALYGDLGVGKTAFVRGFTSVFCPNAGVRSPTFSFVNEYGKKGKTLFHFDMYRIESEDDLVSIGYDDYLSRNGVIIVEWSEHIPFALPAHRLEVVIKKDDLSQPDRRTITLREIKEAIC